MVKEKSHAKKWHFWCFKFPLRGSEWAIFFIFAFLIKLFFDSKCEMSMFKNDVIISHSSLLLPPSLLWYAWLIDSWYCKQGVKNMLIKNQSACLAFSSFDPPLAAKKSQTLFYCLNFKTKLEKEDDFSSPQPSPQM